jgi:Phage minor structural protein GP20
VTVDDDRDVDDFDATIDDDDDDDEYTPPSREEHERMKRALAKANNEAKKSRLKLKELLKASPEGKDGKPDDKNKELDRERIRSEVSEAEEARWKKRVVRQAAKAALLEAGLRGDPTKLARLVDEDDVEVDDDGEISDGLEEQVDSIKEDYPDLFEDKNTPPPRNTRRASINAGGSRERPPARKLTSAEKIQQQVLRTGKRR